MSPSLKYTPLSIFTSTYLQTSLYACDCDGIVSGEKLAIVGQAIYPLEMIIAGKSYGVRVYSIKDSGFEAVLGRDFLEQRGALIDLLQQNN